MYIYKLANYIFITLRGNGKQECVSNIISDTYIAILRCCVVGLSQALMTQNEVSQNIMTSLFP